VPAEGVQGVGQGAGGCLGVGVVAAESVAVEVVGVFGQGEGGPRFAAGQEEADHTSPSSGEQAMSDLDRLEAAISECREMIREAHAATKDLRTAVREAKKELRELTKDEVAGQVHSEVTRQLDEVRERTSEAVAAATQKVIAEFDRFGESLLGKETYWKTASGRRSARRPETDVVELDVPKDDNNG
jgi:hypothetical protein